MTFEGKVLACCLAVVLVTGSPICAQKSSDQLRGLCLKPYWQNECGTRCDQFVRAAGFGYGKKALVIGNAKYQIINKFTPRATHPSS